jgi:uncharacterized protein (DUF58 family)
MGRSRRDVFDDDFLTRLERLRLLAKGLAGDVGGSRRRSAALGDGLEFADYRDYVEGDDVRFIDWPYFARMEKLLVRLFHKQAESDVVLLLDASASMAPAGDTTSFDYALRATAALAYLAMGAMDAVTIFPIGAAAWPPLRIGRDRGRIIAALDYLADLAPGGDTNLDGGVQRLLAQLQPKGLVLLVSDLLDCLDELPGALDRVIAANCRAAVLHVQARRDSSPDVRGAVLLRHAESNESAAIDASPELLAQYQRQWQDFVRNCAAACAARHADYIPADDHKPFDALVLAVLERLGR